VITSGVLPFVPPAQVPTGVPETDTVPAPTV